MLRPSSDTLLSLPTSLNKILLAHVLNGPYIAYDVNNTSYCILQPSHKSPTEENMANLPPPGDPYFSGASMGYPSMMGQGNKVVF